MSVRKQPPSASLLAFFLTASLTAAPTLTSDPTNKVALAGSTVQFAVTAQSTARLRYQWTFNDSSIASATNRLFRIPTVKRTDAGDYAVIVADSSGATTSSTAQLTVLGHLTNQSAAAGNDVPFQADLTGAANQVHFQWKFNGLKISNATNAELLLQNVQSVHTGDYNLTATLANGSYTNTTAHLSVVPAAPSVLVPPVGQTLPAGTDVLLTVLARGTKPLGYQWRLNGKPINGATSPTLRIKDAQSPQAGRYRVIVTNSIGVTNAYADLAIQNSPPVITLEPASQRVPESMAFTFEVGAIGSAPRRYQWLRDAVPATNGINAVLSFASIHTYDEGNYRVIITNDYGAVTSRMARLSVVPLGPPRNEIGWGDTRRGEMSQRGLTNIIAVSAGDGYALALKADGKLVGWGTSVKGASTPPTWLMNVIAIDAGAQHALALMRSGRVATWGLNEAGQTNTPVGLSNVVAIAAGKASSIALRGNGTLAAWGTYSPSGESPDSLRDIAAISAGDEHYLALDNNGIVHAWGTNADGQLDVPPDLSNVVAVAAGANQSLALKNDGTVTKWGGGYDLPAGLANIVAISAGTDHALALTADGTVIGWGSSTWLQTTPPQWLRGVTAIEAGAATSYALTRYPVFLAEPGTVYVYRGSTVQLTAQAASGAPLVYQWQRLGSALPTATNSTLTLSNISTAIDSLYTIIVTNAFGAVTSGGADVVVVPQILRDPVPAVITAGGSIQFSIEVTGSEPLNIMWFRLNTVIARDTTSIFFQNVGPGSSGVYWARVENRSGTRYMVNSKLAGLTVVPPLSMVKSNGNLVFTWPTWPTQIGVYYTEDLNVPNWRPVRPYTLNTPIVVPMWTLNNTQCFFRVSFY